MGLISLLILAAVAGFLFYQLRSVLGQTPHEKNKTPKQPLKTNSLSDRFQSPQKDNVIDITALSDDYEHRFIKASPEVNRDEIIQTLKKIQARYSNFDLNKFIEGAKGAYDMILESFNKNLPVEVKNFMSDEIYDNYRQLLDNYAEKNYTFQTIVTRIDNAVILSAQTNEVSAKITVELNAYNISCLKDENGKVIQGDPDNVIPVTDIWVFERLYSAHNSAWTVVSIV